MFNLDCILYYLGFPLGKCEWVSCWRKKRYSGLMIKFLVGWVLYSQVSGPSHKVALSHTVTMVSHKFALTCKFALSCQALFRVARLWASEHAGVAAARRNLGTTISCFSHTFILTSLWQLQCGWLLSTRHVILPQNGVFPQNSIIGVIRGPQGRIATVVPQLSGG